MKVCFVGIGSIARRHIRNLTELCNEQGIDLRIDALRRCKSDTNLPEVIEHVYTDINNLPMNYDVIFITNPTEYHADVLISLHNHGNHFFIEKPVTSLNSIDKLYSINYRNDSVYYVACPLRYTNVIQYLKKEVDIKKVNSVRSISSSYLPDWRPGTDYRQSYSAHKSLGGGVDIDLIHEWDYLSFLFGMPSEIKSFSGNVSNLEIDSCDYAIYIARFENSMIAELHLDYFGRKNIRTVELITEDETIRGDLVNGTIEYLVDGKTVQLPAERDIYQKRELQYFIDTIIHGRISQNDIKNAVKILKLTQGIID